MPRPYRYHVWDDASFDGGAAFGESTLRVPLVPIQGRAPAGRESKTFYSLVRDFAELRREGAAKGIVDAGLTEIGTTSLGNSIPVLKVGKGTRHKVLFTGAHHSREWISVEIPYYVAEYLVQNYQDNPANFKERLIKRLVDTRTIWFVPMVNVDGHIHTVTTDRAWRANRRLAPFPDTTIRRFWTPEGLLRPTSQPGGRDDPPFVVPAGSAMGVDINRNYATGEWGRETGIGFQVMTSRNPNDAGADSIWCGPSPVSEPETRAVTDLIRSEGFRASITYHNFSQLLLYPDAAEHDGFVQSVGGGMGELINETASPPYTYQRGSELYETTGDVMDFCYEQVPGRPTFTPELRPPENAPEAIHFSGLPEDQIEPCFRENLGAALALINCAGRNRAPRGRADVAISGRLVDIAVRMNCWEVFRGWQP